MWSSYEQLVWLQQSEDFDFLSGATHQEAVNALRTCGNIIHLVVCKGYDKMDIDRAVAEGRLNRTSSVSSRSQSVSSLDVPDEDSQQVL